MLKRFRSIALATFSTAFAVGLLSPVFATHQNFVGTLANTNAKTRAMNSSMPMGALAQVSPVAQKQYYRLQLKYGGKYLDASYCSDNIKLSGFSDYDNGACQLWQLVPSGDSDGYYRLQLKYGGKYLDASYCSDNTKLSGFSDYDNGACQLWQLVPEYVK